MIDPRDEYQKLPDVITKLLERLESEDPTSDEYKKLVDQLSKLTTISDSVAQMTLRVHDAHIKNEEFRTNASLKERELELKIYESSKPDRVSKETLAMIAANIAGIILIIGHERLAVITTKALGFIRKVN